ncbi:MAG: hypothetical protein ABI076_00645 [Acidobacteriaceae bacterium]
MPTSIPQVPGSAYFRSTSTMPAEVRRRPQTAKDYFCQSLAAFPPKAI